MNVVRWSAGVAMILFGLLLMSNTPTPSALASGVAEGSDIAAMVVGVLLVASGLAVLIPPKVLD